MGFYITKTGDSIESIAFEHCFFINPMVRATYLKAFNSTAKYETHSYLFGSKLRANQAIYIPGASEKPPITSKNFGILHSINMLPFEERKKLSLISDEGIDLSTLFAVYDAIVAINEYSGTETTLATVDSALSAQTKLVKKFKKIVKLFDAKLQDYVKVEKQNRHSFAKQYLKPLIIELNEIQKGIIQINYNRELKLKPTKKFALKSGLLSINKHEEIFKISKMLPYLKNGSRGLILLGIVSSGITVFDAYKRGEDWNKELWRELGGLLFGAGGGAAAMNTVSYLGTALVGGVMVTPIGFIIIVTCGVAGSIYFSEFGKKIMENIYNKYKAYELESLTQSINNQVGYAQFQLSGFPF